MSLSGSSRSEGLRDGTDCRRYDAGVYTPGTRSACRIAVVALFCSCAALPVRGEPPRPRLPDTAFLIPWGAGEEELGFRAGPEMEPLCVQTWCITPRGTLLVLDPVAGRIKEFGADGRWIRSWGENLRGSSLDCDNDGALFILDGADLLRVPADGPAEIWTRLPAPVVPGYGQGIRADGAGLAVVDRGQQRCAVSTRDRAVANPSPDGIRLVRSGRGVRASHPGGSVDLGADAGTVLPLGRHTDGTEILEVERQAPDGTWRLEVWLIQANGEEATSRMIDTGPCEDVSVLYRRIVVARDGTIYRARTTIEGFEIQRFAPPEARGR